MHRSTPPLNGANRFAHIDAMRAFAVMLVVVAHAGYGKIVPGGSGVTIFFSISGFIITYLLLRERDKTGGFSASGFYFRRALKIGPPLVLVVIIPSLVYSLWGRLDWGGFLSQVFFVFNWAFLGDKDAGVLPGTAVVWSLSIEEQFYIAFALVWLLAVRSRHWRVIITAVAVAGVSYSTIARMVFAVDPAMSDRIYYGSDTRVDGIAWGVLAAVAFHLWQEQGGRRGRASKALAHDLTFISAIALYILSLLIRDEGFRDSLRYTVQSVAACAIILYGLLPGRGPVRRMFYSVSQWRLVSLIGLSSYSIYLVHLVLMLALKDRLALPLPLEALVLVIVGVGAGIAIYQLVEIPAHRYGRKIRNRGSLKAQGLIESTGRMRHN